MRLTHASFAPSRPLGRLVLALAMAIGFAVLAYGFAYFVTLIA